MKQKFVKKSVTLILVGTMTVFGMIWPQQAKAVEFYTIHVSMDDVGFEGAQMYILADEIYYGPVYTNDLGDATFELPNEPDEWLAILDTRCIDPDPGEYGQLVPGLVHSCSWTIEDYI